MEQQTFSLTIMIPDQGQSQLQVKVWLLIYGQGKVWFLILMVKFKVWFLILMHGQGQLLA